MNQYKAIVAGGLGVIGRNLVATLANDNSWDVIGLSRRKAENILGKNYLQVDLLAPDTFAEVLGDVSDVTHIFHAAYQEHKTNKALIDANLEMLRNLVHYVSQRSNKLQRVVLYEGAKYYGAHLGEFATPAEENSPRHMPPNFYYDMQDWLLKYAENQPWDAVILRPDVVCGFAIGNPMNLAMVIAVYASISKELGLPLRFPGTAKCYTKLAQVTDAAQLAKGSIWAATEARGGEAYNLTNGDIFRWQQLWQKIADYFAMPVGDVQTINLAEMMADKNLLWQKITEKYQLQPIPFNQLASWAFGDFILRCDWDVISSTTKIRQAGFHSVVDSSDMFVRLFDEFRAQHVIPNFSNSCI